jgi:iron complex outermembrane receptor protein
MTRKTFITAGNMGRIIAVCLAVGAGGAAQAQTAVPDSEPGEIIVTARLRAEAATDVPIAITAFDAELLRNSAATTVRDIQHLVPGLNYVERGTLQTELTIRGVGGDSRNPGIDSGVGMYVDGVYVPRTSAYNSDLSDVAQVEVLRGPQGTLFGKNTIGGVINITTVKPSFTDMSGFIDVSYGNYDALRTQATVNVPLGATFAAKVTAATWDRDGYIDNVPTGDKYNNEDRRAGRLQLRWQPGDMLDANLSIDFTRDRCLCVLNQIGSAAGAAAPFFTGDRFRMDADQRNSNARDMWGTSLSLDWQVGNHVITSITAYRDVDILVFSDIDQTPNDILHSGPFTDDTKMFSQELRLTSPGEGPLRYVAGVYYYYQNVESFRDIFVNGNRAIRLDTGTKTKSYAAYLNADYDLMDNLTATAGIRYTHERKNGFLIQERANLNYDLDLRRTDKNVSWTGSLVYKITPRFSAYGTVSRGYKSGGFNQDTVGNAGVTAALLNFEPEKVTNYEVGIKGRIMPGLQLNISAFHLSYRDKQVAQVVNPPVGTVPLIQVTNAGQVSIDGIEVETSLEIARGLNVGGTLSYLDAKYKRFQNAAVVGGVPVDYDGNRVERTPRWTASGRIDMRQPLGTGEIVGNASLSYTGKVFLQPDNLAYSQARSYTLLDARLGYEINDGKVGVYLWGKNLTQKDYKVFARIFSGLEQVVFGEPRTYGVSARFAF